MAIHEDPEQNEDRALARLIPSFAGDVSFDYVLTVCDHAKEVCPVYPGHMNRLHHSFEDPAAVDGSEAQKLSAFRKVRDEIRSYLMELSKLSI